MHTGSSFTKYCRKFYLLVGVFAPPRNVKTMGNRGLHGSR